MVAGKAPINMLCVLSKSFPLWFQVPPVTVSGNAVKSIAGTNTLAPLPLVMLINPPPPLLNELITVTHIAVIIEPEGILTGAW